MVNFILLITALATSVGFGFVAYVAFRFIKDVWNYLTKPFDDAEE